MAKRNHLPFEDWLLANQPLSPYQASALQEHLATCESCLTLKEALNGVERLFRAASLATPKAGFTARWQERQALDRLQRQRQQTWLLFIVSISVALGVLIFFGAQVLQMLQSPTQMLLARAIFISLLVTVLETADAVLNTGLQMVYALPLAGFVLFTGVTSFLGVLWIVTYQKLSSSTRRISL